MKSGLGHIQFNVRAANIPFYKDLFGFLGWNVLHEAEGMVGLGGKNGESFWFIGSIEDGSINYDGPGVNHLAIGAESQADVDAAAAHLTAQGVAMLFETPRHRPDFAWNETDTYYQIMFESPDGLLWEFVYTGPK